MHVDLFPGATYSKDMTPFRSMSPKQLIQFRTRLGWSQAQFARELGVNRSTVNRWEHGRCPIPSLAALALSALRARAARVKHDRMER